MTAFDPVDLDTLWSFDDPAASEVRFRDALETHPGADGAWIAEAMTQLARTQGLQRRFDDAMATLDEAERKLGRDGPARPRIRLLLERGRVLNSSGRREAAFPLFVSAWEVARGAGEDGLAVDAAHMVAIAAEGPLVREWNQRAMDLAESSPDPKARQWRASLLNNMGWTLHEEGDYAGALDLFERALRAREEAGKAGTIRIARWCVARCLRSLGRVPEALAMQQSLRAEFDAESGADGFVFEELGECLLALGRDAEARPAFARALELLSQDAWFAANEPARLERMKTMAAQPGK